MTPQEALAMALTAAYQAEFGGDYVFDSDGCAEPVLAALPEGWALHGPGQCVDAAQYETDTAMNYGEGYADGRLEATP